MKYLWQIPKQIKLNLLIVFLIINLSAESQINLVDSLIKSNSYVIKYNEGKLTGKGAEFLVKATSNSQFLSIGEEHNTTEIPVFITSLFELLQKNNDFNYLALEQDPLRCQIISQGKYKGNIDSGFALVRRFPYSYTFAGDQEIEMMARVSGRSTGNGRPVWGCDQSFGAFHILNELITHAPSKSTIEFTRRYMDSVWVVENNRDNPDHFLIDKCKAEDIEKLKNLYNPLAGSRAEWLLHCLEVSQRIYENNKKGSKVIGVGYNSIYEREEYMKDRFMEEYKYAIARDKKLPKVILKFGHWHIMNGFGPGDVLTTGNFVKSLAKTNGKESFCINSQIFGEPGSRYEWVAKSALYSIFTKNCDIDQWTIFDLRPFRLYYKKIFKDNLVEGNELQKRFYDLIFNYDALLLFGSGKPATYDWKKNN